MRSTSTMRSTGTSTAFSTIRSTSTMRSTSTSTTFSTMRSTCTTRSMGTSTTFSTSMIFSTGTSTVFSTIFSTSTTRSTMTSTGFSTMRSTSTTRSTGTSTTFSTTRSTGVILMVGRWKRSVFDDVISPEALRALPLVALDFFELFLVFVDPLASFGLTTSSVTSTMSGFSSALATGISLKSVRMRDPAMSLHMPFCQWNSRFRNWPCARLPSFLSRIRAHPQGHNWCTATAVSQISACG